MLQQSGNLYRFESRIKNAVHPPITEGQTYQGRFIEDS